MKEDSELAVWGTRQSQSSFDVVAVSTTACEGVDARPLDHLPTNTGE